MNKTKVINVNRDALFVFGAADDDGRTPTIELGVGARIILVCTRYVGPSNCHASYGEERWSMVDYESSPSGIPGNLDPSKCALEGWRGTTDDWSRHAYGVWTIKAIGPSRFWAERPEPKYGFPGEKKVRVELVKVND